MSDRRVFSFGNIQDELLKHFNEGVREEIKYRFDGLVEELTESQVLKATALPVGDQFTIRGTLMRGIIENAFQQQIQFPIEIVRKWAQYRYDEISGLIKYADSAVARERIAKIVSSDDMGLLPGSIVVSWGTRDFQKRLELQAGIGLQNKISPRFSDALVYQLRIIAQTALKRALQNTGKEIALQVGALGEDEAKLLGDDVRRSQSFLDTRGAIRFHVSENRISFNRDDPTPKTTDYRALLDHTLSRIVGSDLLLRIDNKDRQIGNYIREFLDAFTDELRPGFVVITSSILSCLSKQVAHNRTQAPDDEKIDTPSLIMLDDFVQAANLYIQSFESIEEVLRDQQRAIELAKSLAEIVDTAPWVALRSVAYSTDLLEDKSQVALKHLSDAIARRADDDTGLLVVLGMGAARGSLRAMAGEVLEAKISAEQQTAKTSGFGRELVKEIPKEAVKEVTKAALVGTGLTNLIVNFFQYNSHELAQLAVSAPAYFGWLASFLEFVGRYASVIPPL